MDLKTRLKKLEAAKPPPFLPVMVREGETQEQALGRQGLSDAHARHPFPIIDEFPSPD